MAFGCFNFGYQFGWVGPLCLAADLNAGAKSIDHKHGKPVQWKKAKQKEMKRPE